MTAPATGDGRLLRHLRATADDRKRGPRGGRRKAVEHGVRMALREGVEDADAIARESGIPIDEVDEALREIRRAQAASPLDTCQRCGARAKGIGRPCGYCEWMIWKRERGKPQPPPSRPRPSWSALEAKAKKRGGDLTEIPAKEERKDGSERKRAKKRRAKRRKTAGGDRSRAGRDDQAVR